MYVKIHSPTAMKHYGGNKGSCKSLIDYLEKENQAKELQNETKFFDHTRDDYSPYKAQAILDNNKKRLGKNDSKFFMLSINPSEKEQQFLIDKYGKENMAEAMKYYTRDVMDEYAKNFDRGVEGKDLVYFAKMEENRTYQKDDFQHQDTYKHNYKVAADIRQERIKLYDLQKDSKDRPMDFKLRQQVRTSERKMKDMESKYIRDSGQVPILPGKEKGGLNYHVHVVVSRRDMSQTRSLSPLANSKGSNNKLNDKEVKIGFDRDAFVDKCEKSFDKNFEYTRSHEDKYRTKHSKVHNPKDYVRSMQQPEVAARRYAERQINQAIKDKNPALSRQLDKFSSVPKNGKELRDKAIKKGVEAAAKALNVNPATKVVQVAVDVIKKFAKELERGPIRTR